MDNVKITVIKGTFKEILLEISGVILLVIAGAYGVSNPDKFGGSMAQAVFGFAFLSPLTAALWKMARFRLHRWTGMTFKIGTDSGRHPEYGVITEKIRYSWWLPISFGLKAFIFRMVVAEEGSGSVTVVDRTVGEFKRKEWLIKPIGGKDSFSDEAAVNFTGYLEELPGGSVEKAGMLKMINDGLRMRLPESRTRLDGSLGENARLATLLEEIKSDIGASKDVAALEEKFENRKTSVTKHVKKMMEADFLALTERIEALEHKGGDSE